MRVDHVAYRVKDRNKTVEFFIKALKYKIQTEFTIDFGEGDTARCVALEPSEKINDLFQWIYQVPGGSEYHFAPEIFVSDGTPDSIVGRWVKERNDIGAIHHIAYQVPSVTKIMQEWLDNGYAEFSSKEPIKCPGLTQIFTRPSALTGVIYEFIEREQFGFCKDSVKNLMLSTAADVNMR